MLFNSVTFVIFFLITYVLYVLLRHRAQNRMLLIASYVFYGWWDWRFLSLIFLSSVMDYFLSHAMHRSENARVRRRLLLVSIAVNMGILCAFKYMGFFADSMAQLLANFGVETPSFTFLHLVLPVGISFYTFQTMSYTIDVYRRQLAPARSLSNYLLYISFFPQLVAGPIERASRLLPQIENPRRVTYDMIRTGCWLILLGYFKKVVLADNLAPFTRELFAHPDQHHGLEILLGIYAFAWQIYGDFSGYSDIARGIARLLGVDLMENFRMPYLAISPSDFWRRWHIALSTWLRDYLYIPLGGNRGGPWRTHRNLFLTMLLGGLWHGARWNFIAWGAFHGLILILQRFVEPSITRFNERLGPRGKKLFRALGIVLFFQVTCIGWLLFGVIEIKDAATLAMNLFSPFALTGKVIALTLLCFALPMFALNVLKERAGGDLLAVKKWPPVVRLCVYLILFITILVFGVAGGNEFIYFQF
ncbi:MAG: MBOAT family protein [Phycisphaeraceae bacterium]